MNIDTKHLRELEVVTRSASAPDAKWLASNNRKLLYSPRGFTVDCSFAPDAAFVLAAVNNLVPMCDEVDRLRAQLAEAKDALAEKDETEGLRAEVERLKAYDREMSAVMPADFSDWHKNNPSEWPAIAAHVIRNLRQREAEASSEVEMLRKAEAYAQACKRRLQDQIEDAGAENARLRLEIGLLESRQTDEGGQRAVEELRKLRSKAIDYEGDWLSVEIDKRIAAIEAEKPKEAEKVGPDLYDLYANREDCTEGFPDSVTMRRRLDGSEIKYRREAAEKVEPSRKVLVDDILPAAWHASDGDELLRDWLRKPHNPLDMTEGVVVELVRRALAAQGAR